MCVDAMRFKLVSAILRFFMLPEIVTRENHKKKDSWSIGQDSNAALTLLSFMYVLKSKKTVVSRHRVCLPFLVPSSHFLLLTAKCTDCSPSNLSQRCQTSRAHKKKKEILGINLSHRLNFELLHIFPHRLVCVFAGTAPLLRTDR